MTTLRGVPGHQRQVVDAGEVIGNWADVLVEARQAADLAARRCTTALEADHPDDHLAEAEQALTFALVRVKAARRS